MEYWRGKGAARFPVCEEFSHARLKEKTDEAFNLLSVDEICKLADEIIEGFPDDMPKKRLRNRNKILVAKGEIYKRLSQGEKFHI